MTQLDHYLLTLEIIRMSLKCKRWDIRVCVSPSNHRSIGAILAIKNMSVPSVNVWIT